ncbi:hypothetical protein V6Z11_D12G060700 [Gossypium hirsutum]
MATTKLTLMQVSGNLMILPLETNQVVHLLA